MNPKPVILCVDDEKIILESLRAELRREFVHEFEVETAQSAEEGLELAKSLLYDGMELLIAISDQNMPGMKGNEFLSQIKSLSPETHTVLLTGYADLDAVRDAVNSAGLFRYMNKPWKIEELGFTVRQAARSNGYQRRLRDQKVRIRSLTNSMIYALEAANQKSDDDTFAHINRVSAYSAALAKALGKDDLWVERISLYSQLHDIGKVGVACQLLNGPDHFTEREKEIQKQHVRFGFLILSTDGIDEMAANIAHYHHERWDGNGYLQGLRGDQIPLEARIVTVADIFDGLSTARSYKPAVPFEEAFHLTLSFGGSALDPELVAVMREIRQVFRQIHERSLADDNSVSLIQSV
ncbi:MAG: response regulator [Spirochaetales bacterium]|nr:response regulator [Spirochaetales bacterium]